VVGVVVDVVVLVVVLVVLVVVLLALVLLGPDAPDDDEAPELEDAPAPLCEDGWLLTGVFGADKALAAGSVACAVW
jgi:hypothetical protein